MGWVNKQTNEIKPQHSENISNTVFAISVIPDQQNQGTDNMKMVALVKECMREWDQQSGALFTHLR